MFDDSAKKVAEPAAPLPGPAGICHTEGVKLVGLLVALAVLAGCTPYCRDGIGRTIGSPGYKGCSNQCLKKGKECGCSTRCPCWKEH
jgi:hypothetical protein